MNDRLLQELQSRANHRGLVLARAEVLQEKLQCSFDELQRALDELAAADVVQILTPGRFLMLALRGPAWSDRKLESMETPAKPAASVDRAYSYKSSLSESQHVKESYRQPAGSDALLQEILETLGETDPTTFRGALRSYAPGVIRTALARIRRMKNIQKSPTAVFRFLLPRIAKEPAFKK